MLYNRFLVAPQFCKNSLDLAELVELDYFLAGICLYEATFFLSAVLDLAAFLCNQNFSVTGRPIGWCFFVTKVFSGQSSVTNEFRQCRSLQLDNSLVDLPVQ